MPGVAERTLVDRAIGQLSPSWELGRLTARIHREALASHYEAAGVGRRQQGWRRVGGDPNAISGYTIERLRNVVRDLIRNNGHAQSALQCIQDDAVGLGIRASQKTPRWVEWAHSTAIDPDGRCDLVGIQQTVMRTVVEAGECLVRRRRRRLSDGLPLPLQLQVLEPDHLDSDKHQIGAGGARIIRGVEFDPIGRRSAYWLFREHPGSSLRGGTQSIRVPAADMLHVFRPQRPGQVRGIPWFAAVLLRIMDFDSLADATLMKQRVAAVLCALSYDVDGTPDQVGAEDPNNPAHTMLEPGLIAHLPAGRGIEVVHPPSVRDYPDYARFTINEIASGIGVTPEDMTGDYSRMTFSSARMSRLRHFARVSGWRWRMLVPQLLHPIWGWAMQASLLAGDTDVPARTEWTAPGLAMINPDREGLAILRNIRSGITTLSNELRARGYNPDEFLDELQADMEDLDRRGLVLDIDPRKMTQSGQLHRSLASATEQALNRLSKLLGTLPPELSSAIVEAMDDDDEDEDE